MWGFSDSYYEGFIPPFLPGVPNSTHVLVDRCLITCAEQKQQLCRSPAVTEPLTKHISLTLRFFHRCGAFQLLWFDAGVYRFHVCLSVLAVDGGSWGFLLAEISINKPLVPSQADVTSLCKHHWELQSRVSGSSCNQWHCFGGGVCM